jgi:beta-lactamase superfamily II metal-dependent hydrolase
MHLTSLTLLAFYLNGAVDAGKQIGFEEIYSQIEAGTIFEYLKRNVERIDLSLLTAADRDELIEEWQGIANAVDARRKFAVENNGYCLLLAYVIEGIQQRTE